MALIAPTPEAEGNPGVEKKAKHRIEYRPSGNALSPQRIPAHGEAAGDLDRVFQYRSRVARQ